MPSIAFFTRRRRRTTRFTRRTALRAPRRFLRTTFRTTRRTRRLARRLRRTTLRTARFARRRTTRLRRRPRRTAFLTARFALRLLRAITDLLGEEPRVRRSESDRAPTLFSGEACVASSPDYCDQETFQGIKCDSRHPFVAMNEDCATRCQKRNSITSWN